MGSKPPSVPLLITRQKCRHQQVVLGHTASWNLEVEHGSREEQGFKLELNVQTVLLAPEMLLWLLVKHLCS